MSRKQVVEMGKEYPFKNSPTTLCFEAEIKRLAAQREEPIADLIRNLARLSEVSERHIYNYRSGKTEIPITAIQCFCEQFNSLALGLAWLSTFKVESDELDLIDLSRLASRAVRNILGAGDLFLEAFEDHKVDGYEMNKLELAGAMIHRDTRQLVEIARDAHRRSQAA